MESVYEALRFLGLAVSQSVRHPRTPVTYYYCSACRTRFSTKADKCPKCNTKVSNPPENGQQSSVPWWGCFACIVVGIGTWIASAILGIHGLDEAARAMVYLPLGTMFGRTLRR